MHGGRAARGAAPIFPPLRRMRSSAMLDRLWRSPFAASAVSFPSATALMLKLYSYFRSSAAYRVRIALNLKGLRYEILPVHLTKDGGEQRRPEYRGINPQMRVPALAVAGGEVLTQSLAIIDYLEETHPEPPLLPGDPVGRAKIRAIAQAIACDIHPLNNLVVLQYLKRTLKHDQATIDSWYVHWIVSGFEAIEARIAPGPYACGAQVTLADVCLVPQLANARRYKVPLDRFPRIVAADAACQELAAFEQARPENQPDAE
jgi:maleylacetoacetate isomerase